MRPPQSRSTAVRPLAVQLLTLALLALGVAPTALQAAESTRCIAETENHLARLPLAAGAVKSIRIIERTNIADDFGPEIFGVDAWVRLNDCSGWLVINMRPTCYILQTYTRGDCRVEGAKSY